VDLISAIPVEIIDYDREKPEIQLFMKYFKLIRLVKLIRGKKINSHLDRFKDYITYQQFLNPFLEIMKLFFIIITMTHWLACIFNSIRFSTL
jgi:hypothetical protein